MIDCMSISMHFITVVGHRSTSMAKRTRMVLAAAVMISRHAGRVCAFHSASSSCLPLSSSITTNYFLLRHTLHTTSYCSNIFSRPTSSFINSSRINAQNNGDGVEPTWTYVPYEPPPTRRPNNKNNNNTRRRFSTEGEWTIPNHIPIPEDQLTISFARASGAGGQNVNKVNTKVEVRFHLDSASWIPQEVRQRLKSNEANRINNDGYFTVTSQEYRTQLQNRKDVMKKLQDIIKNSWARPKVRKMRKGLSKKSKENRREMKKKISMKKESRRKVDF